MPEASRGVEYRLVIARDKSNTRTLRAFEKQVIGAFDRVDKRTKESQTTAAKGSKRAADSQVGDNHRIAKSAERMTSSRDKAVSKSAEREKKERNKVTVSILRGMEREAKEQQRLSQKRAKDRNKATLSILKGMEREAKGQQQLAQKREAEERRANERIIRDRARAAERLWREAATPAEKYRRKLQELDVLAKRGIGTEQQRAAAAKKAFKLMQRETEDANRGTSRLTSLIRGQTAAFKSFAVGTVGGLVGAGGVMFAVRQVSAAYGEWAKKVEQLGTAHHEFTRGVLRDIGEAGDLAVAPELAAGMRLIGGATRAQKEQLRLGVKDVLPGADVATQLSMIRAAAPVSLLKGGEGLREFTGLMGILREAAPGRTDKQLAGLARNLQQQAGKMAPQLTSPGFRKTLGVLGRSGVPLEESLGFMGAALQQGMRPGSLAAEIGKVTMGREDVLAKIGKQTPQDVARALQGFAGADTKQRLRLLQGSDVLRREILGDASAVLMAGLTQGRVQEQIAGMVAAQQPGFLQQERAAFRRAPEGPRTARLFELELEADIRKQGEERVGLRRLSERRFFEKEMHGRGAIDQYIGNILFSGVQKAVAAEGVKGERISSLGMMGVLGDYFNIPFGRDVAARGQVEEAAVFRAEREAQERVRQAIESQTSESNARLDGLTAAIAEQTTAVVSAFRDRPTAIPVPQSSVSPAHDIQPRLPGTPPLPRGR